MAKVEVCPTCGKIKGREGYGTALKPAAEIIIMARKPFPGTVANNVLKWGTGAINIDGCRVGIDPSADASQLRTMNRSAKTEKNGWGMNQNGADTPQVVSPQGRFPANLIHDGSDEVVGLFPNDASRFFYCAKASKRERNMGCEGLEPKQTWASQDIRECNSFDVFESDGRTKTLNANNHPTVKPLALMRYLCRLVTPPDGVVLDPFCGSGSTLVGALQEGFKYIGIEKEPEYVKIAYHRTKYALREWGLKSKWQKVDWSASLS